jgi:hypothetical protein
MEESRKKAELLRKIRGEPFAAMKNKINYKK